MSPLLPSMKHSLKSSKITEIFPLTEITVNSPELEPILMPPLLVFNLQEP